MWWTERLQWTCKVQRLNWGGTYQNHALCFLKFAMVIKQVMGFQKPLTTSWHSILVGGSCKIQNGRHSCIIWQVPPSVLWRCWLGGRKGIRPVKKTDWWGAGVVICLERGADLHMAQLPLTVSCFSKIQIGFTFLVPAHPGSRGQRAVKRVCVYCLLFLQTTPLWIAHFICILLEINTYFIYLQ